MTRCPRNHVLSLSSSGVGWYCDGRKEACGCISGDGSSSSVSGLPRWRCDSCDFDYCGPCYDSRLSILKVKAIKDAEIEVTNNLNSECMLHIWLIDCLFVCLLVVRLV